MKINNLNAFLKLQLNFDISGSHAWREFVQFAFASFVFEKGLNTFNEELVFLQIYLWTTFTNSSDQGLAMTLGTYNRHQAERKKWESAF